MHFAVDNNIDYGFEQDSGFVSNYLATLESLEVRDTRDVLDIVVLMDSYTGTYTTGNGEVVPYTSDFPDGYYHLTGGNFPDEERAVEISEINSGGVSDSMDFIDWAWSKYPADYVVYSVFNHGGGAYYSLLQVTPSVSGQYYVICSDRYGLMGGYTIEIRVGG